MANLCDVLVHINLQFIFTISVTFTSFTACQFYQCSVFSHFMSIVFIVVNTLI